MQNASVNSRLRAASLLVDCGAGLLGLALPLYATLLGASPAFLGLLGAGQRAAYIGLCTWAGRIADKVEPKSMVVTATGTLVLVYAGMAVADGLPALLLLTLLVGGATAFVWAPVMTWLSQGSKSLDLERETTAFSFAWSSGVLLGGLAAGLLFDLRPSLPFWTISVILGLATVIFVRTPRVRLLIRSQLSHPTDVSDDLSTDPVEVHVIGGSSSDPTDASDDLSTPDGDFSNPAENDSDLAGDSSPPPEGSLVPSESSTYASGGFEAEIQSTPRGAERGLHSSALLRLSWLGAFVIFFTVGVDMTLFPKMGVDFGLSASMIAFAVAGISVARTATFFILSRCNGWSQRPQALLAAVFLSGLGGVGVAFVRLPVLYFLCFACVGVGSGVTVSYSLHHSLNAESEQGRKAGIHEMMLNAGVMAGSLSGGLLAQFLSFGAAFWAAGALSFAYSLWGLRYVLRTARPPVKVLRA